MAHHEEPVPRFPAAGGMTDDEIRRAEEAYEDEWFEASYREWEQRRDMRRTFGLEPDDETPDNDFF